MSYKNDHLLVIANKYGKASADAKAELFETYDKIKDITVSGPSIDGSGYGPSAKFLINMARLIAPSSFMPILGNDILNIPGTSFFSPVSGGTAITPGGQSAFGMDPLSTYPGFPSGGAASITDSLGTSSGLATGSFGLPILSGIGNTFSSLFSNFTVGGSPTGAASSLDTLAPMAGAVSGVAAGAAQPQGSIVIPAAGVLAGIGGIVSSVAPYFGPFGIAGGLMGNLLNGYAGAVLSGYQTINTRVLNNADVILQSKVRNIETVCKQLEAQTDIVRKMIKDIGDGDKQALQNLL